jgi:histidyl-tRNA synthetase
MFSPQPVPSVGFSIGIERIFAILEEKYLKDTNLVIRENPSECIVASIPSKTIDLTPEKMKVYSLLWDAGFKCDFNYRLNWNLGKQLTYAND